MHRALHSQCRDHQFESGILHHSPSLLKNMRDLYRQYKLVKFLQKDLDYAQSLDPRNNQPGDWRIMQAEAKSFIERYATHSGLTQRQVRLLCKSAIKNNYIEATVDENGAENLDISPIRGSFFIDSFPMGLIEELLGRYDKTRVTIVAIAGTALFTTAVEYIWRHV